jgi:hypothetical protein
MTKLTVPYRGSAKAFKDGIKRHVFGTESVDNLQDYLGQHVC